MDAIVNNSIEQITTQIITYKQVAATSILEIGRLLIQAKEQLPHGEWGSWLRDRVEFSERSANNFMRVAREYASNPQLVADLGIRKAIALLDVPEEEREAFAAETNAAQLTTRQLEEAIRDRDQAREDLATKEAALNVTNGCLSAREAELTQARKELEELRARPVEVAVETVVDEAAVKKAAREAAKEAKEKAEQKAAKALEAEQARVKELEQQLEAAKSSNDAQRAEAAEAKAEELRKQLAIAQNEDVYGVQICFEQIKELANRMQGHILRLQARGQIAEYEKCRNAQRALAMAMTQAAEG